MADKKFMIGGGGTFDGAGASGNFSTASEIAKEVNSNTLSTTVNNTVKNAIKSPTSATASITRSSVSDTESQSAFQNDAKMQDKLPYAFLPNLLDNYDVYTYHWKLFMVPLSAAASGQVLNTSIQTIIAESGVSDLTIDKVELYGITTPSVESGTGTMTHVKFEIIEPSGAGLLDKIFYESVALGIGNWMVTPYFLQLQFRGRDPVTEDTVINGAPGGLGALQWVWPIKLTSSKINVTHVGTRYEFDAIMYDELAQSNSYFSIQHNISLNKLKTFGDAMVDLEKKLNADCYEKLIDNYSIPDTYRIVVDPILANTLLVNPDSNKNTARASDFVDFSKKTAAFTSGTSVDKIVDSLLGSTSLGQQKVQGSNTPSSQPNSINAEQNQMKKLWRVITETKPIAFDALRQDNAVAMTIYVVEYDIGVLDADASQTGQTPDTKVSAKKRLNEYLSKLILRKKYNYIFTGLNDQIINLDLNLNYAFAAATARFGGIYIDSAAGSTKGVSQEETQENERKAGEIIRKTLQFVNEAEPNTDVDSRIDEAKKSISATKVSPTIANRYNTLLENSRPANKQAFVNKLQTSGGLAANGQIGPYDKNGNLIATRQYGSLAPSVTSSPTNLTFVSDVEINSNEAQTTKSISESIRKGKLRPIPYREAIQDSNLKGIDPASDAGRARTSSMFATALYSTLDASMQSIKMTIKGDPFWLFPRNLSISAKSLSYKSNLPDNVAISEIKLVHKDHKDSVNLFGTDNFIIIRFRTPRIYNDTTGVVDPFTEAEAFSGVYKVTRIISKFENGKFTQDIEAILDPVIDLSDAELRKFLYSIEDAVKQPDPETHPTASGIPQNAVKSQKLSSTSNLIKGFDNTSGITPVNSLSKTFGKTASTATSNIPSVSIYDRLAFEKDKRGN